MKSKSQSVKAPFDHALDQAQPALESIDEADFAPVRHDMVNAVVTVLGVIKRVTQYRGEVSAQLGEDVAKYFDDLPDAVRACGGAHVYHLVNLHDGAPSQTVEALSRQHAILLAEANTLVALKKLPASALAELAGGNAQKALCFDTLQLVAAFRQHWAAVSPSTAVTVDELDGAESLANLLATALGEQEQGTSQAAPTAEQRRRAYTYFVQTYDEVRRAMHYVRWDEGDADDIAPSLSAGRARHAVEAAPAPSEPIVPIVPVTTPSSAGSIAAPATTTVVGAPSAAPFGSS